MVIFPQNISCCLYILYLLISGAAITKSEQAGLGMVDDGTKCADGKVLKNNYSTNVFRQVLHTQSNNAAVKL